MNHSEHTPLMHAVLDGEATPGETLELDRLLAADSTARAEFDELKRLFEGLQGVPREYPPEGLVASVMANIPQNQQHPAWGGRIRQLFSRSRVIGADPQDAPVTNPGKSATVHPIRGPYFRGDRMNEQKKGSFGSRKIWIGAGIAAATAIVAVSTGLFPPSGTDTSGTIVPAQRYRAAQPTAADVKLGDQAGSRIAARQCEPAATVPRGNDAARQRRARQR